MLKLQERGPKIRAKMLIRKVVFSEIQGFSSHASQLKIMTPSMEYIWTALTLRSHIE